MGAGHPSHLTRIHHTHQTRLSALNTLDFLSGYSRAQLRELAHQVGVPCGRDKADAARNVAEWLKKENPTVEVQVDILTPYRHDTQHGGSCLSLPKRAARILLKL